MADQQTSMLDEINKEVSELSDEQIAAAAEKILARQAKARSSMTEERKTKEKANAARRRQLDKAILAQAKAKGITGKPVATA